MYQDYILAVEFGAAAVLDIDEGLRRILTSIYGIQLSNKAEAVKPFRQQGAEIGASNDLKDIRNIR